MAALQESSPEPSGRARERPFVHRGLPLPSEAREGQAGPRATPRPVLLSWVMEVPGGDAQPRQGLRKPSPQTGSLWQCSPGSHGACEHVPAVTAGLGQAWLHPRG